MNERTPVRSIECKVLRRQRAMGELVPSPQRRASILSGKAVPLAGEASGWLEILTERSKDRFIDPGGA